MPIVHSDAFSDFVLKALPLAVVITDVSCRIVKINATAQDFFGLSDAEAHSHLCGDVFKCINSRLPQGCGSTQYCPKCVFRKSIDAVFRGENVTRHKGDFAIYKDGEVQRLSLLITAAPIFYQETKLAIILIEDVSLITELSGLLPMCCVCHKIRDVQGEWVEVAQYIKRHSEAEFTHDYCPECGTLAHKTKAY